MSLISLASTASPGEDEARGAHYVEDAGVHVSRLNCGNVAFLLRRGDTRLLVEIPAPEWPKFLERLNTI